MSFGVILVHAWCWHWKPYFKSRRVLERTLSLLGAGCITFYTNVWVSDQCNLQKSVGTDSVPNDVFKVVAAQRIRLRILGISDDRLWVGVKIELVIWVIWATVRSVPTHGTDLPDRGHTRNHTRRKSFWRGIWTRTTLRKLGEQAKRVCFLCTDDTNHLKA